MSAKPNVAVVTPIVLPAVVVSSTQMFLPFVLSSFKYSFVPELASIDATTFLAVNAASLLIPATISASVTFEPAPPAAVTVTSTLQMFTFKPSCEPVKLIPLRRICCPSSCCCSCRTS